VNVTGEPFFEFDVSAFLLAALEGLLKGGPVSAHARA
jgi:hypothetical protein